MKKPGERTDLAPIGARSNGKSSEATAQLLGIGTTTVARARKVNADAAARKAVESGKKSINAAYNEVRAKERGTGVMPVLCDVRY